MTGAESRREKVRMLGSVYMFSCGLREASRRVGISGRLHPRDLSGGSQSRTCRRGKGDMRWELETMLGDGKLHGTEWSMCGRIRGGG